MSKKTSKQYQWHEYRLFYVLIGSTISEEVIKFLDFPSPDSVVEFIESF